MPLWDSSGRNDRFRCRRCNDAIALLIPAIPDRLWALGFVDRAAYDAHRRRVVELNHRELHAMADPLRARIRTAYAALARLFNAADDVLVRDQVAILISSGDLLTDATITNWWVGHRYRPYDPAEPG